jgi:hypothetical protein
MPDTVLKEALLSGASPGYGHNSGATPPVPQPPAETPLVVPDLLRGAGQICIELYGADTPANRRRLYHEQDRWPLFRLESDGVFYALRSRLRAFVEAKSAEREAEIAAAQAEREAQIAAGLAASHARGSRQPKRRQRKSQKQTESEIA